MAWPSSPLTTYVATVIPYIKAFDLNAIQNAINGIVSVTTIGGQPDKMYSLCGVWLDGSGGAIIDPIPGSLRASKAVNSTTYPTPSGDLVQGEYCRDNAPASVASISGGFVPPLGAAGQGLTAGFGIYDLLRNGAGDYDVTFMRVPTANDPDNSSVAVTPISGTVAYSKSVDGGNRLVVNVVLTPAVDIPFDIQAWIW